MVAFVQFRTEKINRREKNRRTLKTEETENEEQKKERDFTSYYYMVPITHWVGRGIGISSSLD